MQNELKPCPKCGGDIIIWVNIERGAYAKCVDCKKEYPLCGIKDVPTYQGVKIRKSTVRKIEKMWNRRANND